jgi:hypothetical protein
MVEPRHGSRFSGEAVVRFATDDRTSADELDRPELVQPQVSRPIDDAHAALTEFFVQFEPRQGEGCRWRLVALRQDHTFSHSAPHDGTLRRHCRVGHLEERPRRS